MEKKMCSQFYSFVSSSAYSPEISSCALESCSPGSRNNNRRRTRRIAFSSGTTFVSVLLALIVLLSAAVPSYSSSNGKEVEAVGRFRDYLNINTAHPLPDYKPAVEFLLAQASEIGLDSQVLEFVEGKPLVLLTWKGKDPSIPSILLNSHMDVVPAEREKWLYEPFAAVQARTSASRSLKV
jgi:aminoacylase